MSFDLPRGPKSARHKLRKKLSGFNTSTSTLFLLLASHRNTLRKNSHDYLRKVLFSFSAIRLKIKPAFFHFFLPSINIQSFFFGGREAHILCCPKIFSRFFSSDDSRNKLLHFLRFLSDSKFKTKDKRRNFVLETWKRNQTAWLIREMLLGLLNFRRWRGIQTKLWKC